MHDPLLDQVILACPICGARNGCCNPQPHKKGVARMTKARAASLAITSRLDDFKTLAAGDGCDCDPVEYDTRTGKWSDE
jgi:hypothetical protein